MHNLSIISKTYLNKTDSELNFLQKSHSAYLSTSPRSGKCGLHLESNEEIVREIWRFFAEIVKKHGKFIKCSGGGEDFENITRDYEENFEKNEK